jgi:alkylated DNA repair dioxygenase AlkB
MFEGSSQTQTDMFSTVEPDPVPDVLWAPVFLSPAEHAELFDWCRNEINWQYLDISISGRSVPVPRGLAWFGDVPYSYSGLKHPTAPMPPQLRTIADRIEAALATNGTPAKFNSVLLNFYRSGRDSIGMHSDDEKQLRRRPVIASVSLGCTRTFRFQHKSTKTRHDVELVGGSLLVMKGDTQDLWRHGIDKDPQLDKDLPICERINLTFRFTYPEP